MKPLSECRLYTFVDTAYLHGREPGEVARQLCDGGSDIIQLRAKNSTASDIQRMAESVLPITRAAGVPLVINDHLEIARQVGAEFCHLGQEDFFNAGYRNVSEIKAKRYQVSIGLSTHAPAHCERAVAAGADYVAIGPVFATGTKPTAKPVTLDYVRWAADHVQIPWFAIGGINLETIDSVLQAGAKRLCVVSAILNVKDIASECSIYKDHLSRVAC